MYVKLALRNVRRSAREYLIYMVTLILCVGMFYAFLSVSSRYYRPNIGAEYDLSMLGNGMRLAALAITVVILFLVYYVNQFMIRRKQKAFALQTVMGMEQRTTAWLFFIETLVAGGLAILAGILLGAILSQGITAILLNSFGASYRVYFPLYPDTIGLTIIFFLFVFIVTGLFNIRTIRKIKVIDMLQAEHRLEQNLKNDRWLIIWISMAFILALAMLLTGGISGKGLLSEGNYLYKYYDRRYPLLVKCVFAGNLTAPLLFIAFTVAFLFISLMKKHLPISALVGGLTVNAGLIIIFALWLPVMADRYYIPLDNDLKNTYLFFAGFFLIFAICCFFYFISDLLLTIKNKSLKFRYRNENLFLLGQLCARLKTTSKTMAVTSITLAVSIMLILLAPMFSGWIMGYLDTRAPYEVQLFSRYNDVYTPEELAGQSYEEITDYILDIYNGETCVCYSYFSIESDMLNRQVSNFPVLVLSLTDYNQLRSMAGYESVSLADHEFTTQWYATADREEIGKFIGQNSVLDTDGGRLLLSETSYYQDNLGEYIYNDYTDVLFIVPDHITELLQKANYIVAINGNSFISYEDALELQNKISEYDMQLAETSGFRLEIRLSILQNNDSVSAAFLFRMIMMYAGIVLLIICFTVLSLHQLSDALDYRYRFGVLKKIGVEEVRIKGLITRQMIFWFGLPVLLASILAVILSSYFISSYQAQLAAYVGINSLIVYISIVSMTIIILLISYFVSTWYLFQRNISGKGSM